MTTNQPSLTQLFATQIDSYNELLLSHCHVLHRRWKSLVDQGGGGNFEGAIAESVAFEYLRSKLDSLEVNEDPSTGGPDWRATCAGEAFLIEVTNISLAAATKASSLSHWPAPGLDVTHPLSLAEKIRDKVQRKKAQVNGESLPTVLFVTTLHFQASIDCFEKYDIEELAVGKTHHVVHVDKTTKQTVGEVSAYADLSRSIFYRKDGSLYDPGLCALLVGGFGTEKPRVFGVAHPSCPIPFDPSWIREIPFVYTELNGSRISARWRDSPD